jgi:hypothetical protein
MKIGISRPTRDLEETRTMLALAQKLGFDGVQLKPDQYVDADGVPNAEHFLQVYGPLGELARAGLIVYCPQDMDAWQGAVLPVLELAGRIGAGARLSLRGRAPSRLGRSPPCRGGPAAERPWRGGKIPRREGVAPQSCPVDF